MIHSLLKKAAFPAIIAAMFAFAPASAIANGAVESEDLIAFSSGEEAPLSSGEMEVSRGAASINTFSSKQALSAETSGNTLNVGGNLTNGNVAVGDNMGGFGSYVMNTGNNSTINSAVSLNVQIMSNP